MNITAIKEALEAIVGVRVSVDEPMSRHTTLKLGGPADLFIRIDVQQSVSQVLAVLFEGGCPWLVMGLGSNLLVTDGGIEGAVLVLDGEFGRISFDAGPEGPFVDVGASVRINRLLAEVERAGYGGLEFMTGIPATVGGLIAMNGGTRYGYVNSVLDSLCVADRRFNRRIQASGLGMGYRTGNIPDDVVVLNGRLSLVADPGPDRHQIATELASLREKNHPPITGSCGSFFKNPDPSAGLFAGKLIEEAGLKGMCIGDAQVSNKHANFLVNKGKATSLDLLELAESVRKTIHDRNGVELLREVRIVGRGSDEWRVRVP